MVQDIRYTISHCIATYSAKTQDVDPNKKKLSVTIRLYVKGFELKVLIIWHPRGRGMAGRAEEHAEPFLGCQQSLGHGVKGKSTGK